MAIFWINLEINFDEPMPVVNKQIDKNEKEAQGFFQDIGCTADDEQEAKVIITKYLERMSWLNLPKAEVLFDKIGIIPADEITSEVYEDPDIKDSLIGDPLKEGIWYVSGKAFFGDEFGEDEFYEVKIEETD